MSDANEVSIVREPIAVPTVEQALRATNQHYEFPPTFFARFLDRRLKYSSGLYLTPGATLDDAQTEKLHFIAKLLDVRSGSRLLDIGCGWGSLSLFMAEEYGCRVTGVTPSRAQADHIRKCASTIGVEGRIDVIVGPFSEVPIEVGFDAVTMVGSINHMPNQDDVLAKVHGLMHDEARLYLSESCFRSASKYKEFARRPGTLQVTEGIFGFAEMHPLSTLVRVVEDTGLSLTGVTDLTWHFKRTVNDWIERAVRERQAIEDIVPGMSEPLLEYLRTTNLAWGYTTKQYALTAVRSRLGVAGLT
ncbi:SAM-dependent methyltransferase [Amycolatopsis pigmentata]|uniref:SAM-dependent methyltransferase n=1 Tax=Amycolatopsis pigmentata TaxID=450801 RepID=A0ABW5FIY3_9PSEU